MIECGQGEYVLARGLKTVCGGYELRTGWEMLFRFCLIKARCLLLLITLTNISCVGVSNKANSVS